MAGHAQLKFVMTECSKTQIRLTRPNCENNVAEILFSITPSLPLKTPEIAKPLKGARETFNGTVPAVHQYFLMVRQKPLLFLEFGEGIVVTDD